MSLVGERFGRWFVKELGEPYTFPSTNHSKIRYICKCDCGEEKLVREDSLLRGDSKSCGCLAKEKTKEAVTKHGLSRHKLYNVWNDMRRRCNDPSRKDYKHYGQRGITVCERWNDELNGLNAFLEDMSLPHENGLELDRIDVNGNYCKENCRWVDRRTQVINRRFIGNGFDAHLIEFNGEKLCISQWADKLGINKQVISDRLGKLNWDVERAFTTPVKVKQYFVIVVDLKIPLERVFKHTPNLYPRARRSKASLQEFLSGLFYDKFKIVGVVNKIEVEFKATVDFSNVLEKSWLTEEFKNICCNYGVKL